MISDASAKLSGTLTTRGFFLAMSEYREQVRAGGED
uniref:Uncharacterized protein n=1 Tax=Caenorhabditis japonica TaxID=281687 RepID=A0A8R1IIG9_CAEJA